MNEWPTNFTILETFGNHGQVSPRDRYTYHKIEIDGEHYFYKEAKTPEVGKLLDHDVTWIEYLNHFRQAHPELNVRPLTVYAYKPQQAIITEFIDAPFVADVPEVKKITEAMDRYVDLLVAMDDFGKNWQPTMPIDPNKPPKTLDANWQKWITMGNLLEKGVLKEQDLTKAKAIVDAYEPLAERRMQHGDMGPWHMFNVQDEWVIFDAEHASNKLPRFYDLAWAYSRFYMRSKDRGLVDGMLQLFLQKTQLDPDYFFPHFLPVLTSRAIGMLLDAENDLSEVDYRQEAQALLQRCLSAQNLEEFLEK